MDKEMVEVSSMEFTMATGIAEAKALDPATLEEARRRMDWPKWDLAIKAELEALKKAGTWGVVERLRGRNIVVCKWVLHIKKNAAGRIECYKARFIANGFIQVYDVDYYKTFTPVAKLASIWTYLPLLLAIIGQLTCLISTAPSLMGNSMRTRKYSWSNHLAMKNPTRRNIPSSYTSHSMDLNKLDANGTRLCAAHLPNWDLRSARPTRLSSIFPLARIF